MDARPRLRGRDQETATIGRLLAEAETRGSCLILQGSPGVGKSALLEWASHEARERFLTLRATGTPAEFGLPFAALHQLLRPTLHLVDDLDPPHDEVLRGAFGQPAGTAPDVHSVSMAALELLSEAATKRPVLLLVDDAQWMDPSSQQTIAFIARRLASDRVVLLATHRESAPDAWKSVGLRSSELQPLDPASASALLDSVADDLDGRSKSRVLTIAQGNPLALVELPRAVSTPAAAPFVDIPLTTRLEQSFLARIDEFDAWTISALEVAALNDSDDAGEVLAAVAAMRPHEHAEDVLSDAISADLVSLNGKSLRFRHPLIRSALRARIQPRRLAQVHQALAGVVRNQPDRAVWHRAAAAQQPDDDLADALERSADEAVRRGAPRNAVNTLDRAAQLSTELTSRLVRTYRAATLAYTVGMLDRGEDLREDYRRLAQSEQDHLRYEWLRELAGGEHGGDLRVQRLIDLAERAKQVGDSALTTDFLRAAALRCWNFAPGSPLGRQVVSMTDLLDVADVPTRAEVLAYAAPFDSWETVRSLVSEVPVAERDPTMHYRLAHACACAGLFDLSEDLLTEAIHGLRTESRLQPLGRALSLLSWSAMRRGHWSASVAAAGEAAQLCVETRQPFWHAAATVAHGVVAGFRGDLDLAERLVGEAEQMNSAQFATINATSLVARAAIATGRNEHETAFELLAQLHDVSSPAHHPAHALWSLASLAEAAGQCGRIAEARLVVDALSPTVRDTTSPTGRMNLAIARAVLAADDEAEFRYGEALGTDMTTWPFERNRLLLSYGRQLRRDRRIRESRDYLRRARDGFDHLGARLLAEVAREELRAAGEQSATASTDVWTELTPQELQIVLMVAEGLSNKEIANRLFISHRTVGSHLYRIFPKVGVVSRGQLQRLAADRHGRETRDDSSAHH